MSVDERQLGELLVESRDLHADAMRRLPAALDDLTEFHHDRAGLPVDVSRLAAVNERRQGLARSLSLRTLIGGGLLAGGFASVLSGIIAKPVRADHNLDNQILQTASSLEILAVATYGVALTLPFIANGNAVVKAFAMTTMSQHDEHRQAFQSQNRALGGAVQINPNPKYAAVVEQAKPMLQGPADVVQLAAALEKVATETYLMNLTLLADTPSKAIFASVMGVECQHLATLRAVGALLAGGAPELIALPTNVAALPAAAGSVAFPNPLEGTADASPPQEGAVA